MSRAGRMGQGCAAKETGEARRPGPAADPYAWGISMPPTAA